MAVDELPFDIADGNVEVRVLVEVARAEEGRGLLQADAPAEQLPEGLVGVLSAIDIFRRIQEIAKEEISMSVSGLTEDSIWQFPEIKAKIGGVLEKFSKSFNIRNVSVHVKEDKSTFEVFLYFDTDDGHISLSTERKALKEAVDQLADELDAVLLKKKEKKHTKARRVNSGREEEVL